MPASLRYVLLYFSHPSSFLGSSLWQKPASLCSYSAWLDAPQHQLTLKVLPALR